MASNRWTYQVVLVKPRFFGSVREAAQEKLNQFGMQGWELVCATQSHQLSPVHLYLKKEMP